jgi:hypothetical protein
MRTQPLFFSLWSRKTYILPNVKKKRGRGTSKQGKWHVDDAITNHVQTEQIPSTVYYKSISHNKYYIWVLI